VVLHRYTPFFRGISFRIKLGLAIVLLTTGLTSTSVLYFYQLTEQFTLQQTQKDLKRLGHTASLLFNENDRRMIAELTAAMQAEALRNPQVKLSDIQALKVGDTINSLSVDARNKLQNHDDFQRLVYILRQLKYVGQDQINPLKRYYPQEVSISQVRGFIIVPAPEFTGHRVVKILASGSYQPQGTWPGNPIGNLYAPSTENFFRVFEGEMQVDDQFIHNSFYTALGVLVPIKNHQGETIAALGLDYIAGSELDQLDQFKAIGIRIIGGSFMISSVLAMVLAQWLGRPITKLQQASQSVRDGDYQTVITFHSRDELGILADTFNQMVAEIRRYSHELEAQNQQQAQFLDALPIGVAVHRPDGSIVYCNQVAQQMFAKMLIYDVHLDELPSVYQLYQEGSDVLYPLEKLPVYQALQGESVCCDDIEVHNTPDHIIPLEALATPILDQKNRIQYAIVAFQDITERKQAEKMKLINTELQKIVTIDGLTQIANRYHFDEYLQQQWQSLGQEKQPLSLILFDVDYFKRYNDYYGHQAGDHCLRQVAQGIQTAVNSKTDLVARYGGEEFAVILPYRNEPEALIIAAKIQEVLRAKAIPHAQSEISPFVSVSLGIATMIPKEGYFPDVLIARADQCLYCAKRQGRNRIVSDASCQAF
jgi:diguanylate cyclase (GGDEF)-like protein